MKYAAIYVRVSSIEQKKHGLSVDNQIDSLVKYCKAKKLKYKIYNDAGISAHATYKKRPALLQLIEDCQRGEVSIILFTRLDRWFRSVKDYYLVTDQLAGVPWRAIWEDYETETSSGQLKVNIMLSIAEAEASRTSEKIRSVIDYKVENGSFFGSAPLGYKLETENGITTLVKDEKTRPVVECFFRNYLQTFSVRDATKKVNEAGYKISQAHANRMARNETYTGVNRNAHFEPYITRKEYETILEQRKIRTRATSAPSIVYIFGGLLRCRTCGYNLNSYSNKLCGDSVMYRCTHSSSKDGKINASYNRIYEKDLEEFFIDQLDFEMEKARREIEVKISPLEKDNAARAAALQKRMERLKDLYIDGEISRDEYQKRKGEFEEELNNIEIKPKRRVPDLPEDWKEIYTSLSRDGKKAFIRRVVDHIEIDYGEIHDKARFHLFIRLVL